MARETSSSAPSVTAELDAGLRAARAGALVDVLDHLRAAWARVRSPRLAALIERVAAPLAAERPAISGAKRGAIERAWLQRAAQADAVELSCLLPSAAHTSTRGAIERLRALAVLGPAPRLARASARLLIDAPFSSTAAAKFWRTVEEVLVASAVLPGYDAPLHRRRARALAALEPALAQARLELEPDELERCAALERALDEVLAARPRTGSQLRAAIYAEPAELSHRQVYADFLLAQGDPEGEFIALQLADDRGELDRRGRKRMRALLRQHQHAWLGPLAPVVTRAGVVFARGFPIALRCRVWPARPERTVDEPGLASRA